MPRKPWADRGSRHERGYDSRWVKTRLRILKRDDYLCQPCIKTGRPTPATQVDHIIPKAKGGSDDDENLQSICPSCHKIKSEREAAQAQGRTIKARIEYTADGRVVWPK